MKELLRVVSKNNKKIINILVYIYLFSLVRCSEPSSPTNSSWIPLGLNLKNITKIKTTKTYVYACASYDGLFRHPISSTNSDWEYIGLEHTTLIHGIDTTKGVNGPNTVGINDVIINPNNENEILAAIVTLKPNVPGIYKTTDGGKHWYEADSGYGFIPYWWPDDSGKFNPWKSAQVLFNPANQFDIIFAGDIGSDGIYWSTNSGLTWQALIKPTVNAFSQVNSFLQDPIDANIIYIGGSSSHEDASVIQPAWFIKSTNGIESAWETLIPKLPDNLYFNNIVDDICITTKPNTIYLGMRGFVLGNRDGGKTWNKLLTDPEYISQIFSIEVSPKNEKHLLAANGYIFLESLDAGRTWIKLRKPSNGMVNNLHWDKLTDNLYVETNDRSGIYVLPNASSLKLNNLE